MLARHGVSQPLAERSGVFIGRADDLQRTHLSPLDPHPPSPLHDLSGRRPGDSAAAPDPSAHGAGRTAGGTHGVQLRPAAVVPRRRPAVAADPPLGAGQPSLQTDPRGAAVSGGVCFDHCWGRTAAQLVACCVTAAAEAVRLLAEGYRYLPTTRRSARECRRSSAEISIFICQRRDPHYCRTPSLPENPVYKEFA